MTADFILNIVAGLALLALGFISRQLVARFQTRATRRLWRGFSGKAGLTIAMTNWKGPTPRSGTRTSFGEVRVLITLIPTLVRLGIPYRLTESTMRTATEITRRDLLLIGGPDVNEISKKALELLLPRLGITIEIDSASTSRAFVINGRRYATEYGGDRSEIQLDYGVIVRCPNPFSANPHLSATIVMGSHGLGTTGAALVLIDEYLAGLLLRRTSPAGFIAVVGARRAGDETAVEIEYLQSLSSI
jgi:hypothetical protein